MRGKKIIFVFFLLILFHFFPNNFVFANEDYYFKLQITPIPCGCPYELNERIYKPRGEACATDFEDFKKDPIAKHYWIRDEQITQQGKANERARQFIYWVISHPSIDNHQSLLSIWSLTRNITYFFIILVVALFGIVYFIGQRTQFNLGIQVWPAIYKTLIILIYTTFSATLVLFFIQLSDILMKFFIERLKGDQIFNIYFTGPKSVEINYLNFFGCRDLNLNVQEAVKSELFLLKATNITYYVMGIMLILRKVILWFMLFVSPFLALLLPFVFIRNIGWIWVGVFFQWLFYGPLFALFLGALAKIWQNGIPFVFDFSRAGTVGGHIFPTAINIYYGGPAQGNPSLSSPISILNNGNYIDTFAEYVISLIMLWAVIFFPWWLLRIFRDYCCDGIYAMKNILLSIYDQMRNPPSPQPSPPLSPSASTIAAKLKVPEQVEIPVKVKLETIEEIKKAKTEEITRSLNIRARTLTDIARFETNKQMRETVIRNINYLKNPIQAESPKERERFMNLKTELYQRAIKQDVIAKNIISSISTSVFEQQKIKEAVIKTIPQAQPVSVPTPTKTTSIIASTINSFVSNNQFVNQLSQTTNLSSSQIQNVLQSFKQHIGEKPAIVVEKIVQETGVEKEKVVNILTQFKEMIREKEEVVQDIAKKEMVSTKLVKQAVETPINLAAQPTKISSVINQVVSSFTTNAQLINQLSQITNLSPIQIQNILNSFQKNITEKPIEVIEKIVQETQTSREKVVGVLRFFKEMIKEKEEVTKTVAQKENVSLTEVKQIVETPINLITEPEKPIEETISIPPSVTIDEYEQVKKMWIDHYERGELPVSENITDRRQWVERDIVFITNTLNKLLSPDPKLKQEGLDDVSYILPIFLINNLSGEQLVAYLKAKLEAAKEVKRLMEKEEEIKEKLKAETEEKVAVPIKKKEEAKKTMEIGEEI